MPWQKTLHHTLLSFNKKIKNFLPVPYSIKSKYYQQITNSLNAPFQESCFQINGLKRLLQNVIPPFLCSAICIFSLMDKRVLRTSFLSNCISIALFRHWRRQWLVENNRIEGILTATYDFAWLITCLKVPLAAMSPDVWAADRPDRPRAATRARQRRGAGGAKERDGPEPGRRWWPPAAAQLECSGSNSPSRGWAKQGRKVALPPRAWSPSWRQGQWPPWGASTPPPRAHAAVASLRGPSPEPPPPPPVARAARSPTPPHGL